MTTIDGIPYEELRNLIWEGCDGRVTIKTVPPTLRAVNTCNHCHRSDLREVVARSVAEAVELGWLAPVEVQPVAGQGHPAPDGMIER